MAGAAVSAGHDGYGRRCLLGGGRLGFFFPATRARAGDGQGSNGIEPRRQRGKRRRRQHRDAQRVTPP